MEKLEPGPCLCLSWAYGVFPGAQLLLVAHCVWLWEPPCVPHRVEVAGVGSPSLRAWRGPLAQAGPSAGAVFAQAELWARWACYLPAPGSPGAPLFGCSATF